MILLFYYFIRYRISVAAVAATVSNAAGAVHAKCMTGYFAGIEKRPGYLCDTACYGFDPYAVALKLFVGRLSQTADQQSAAVGNGLGYSVPAVMSGVGFRYKALFYEFHGAIVFVENPQKINLSEMTVYCNAIAACNGNVGLLQKVARYALLVCVFLQFALRRFSQ
jgi:hypothetical protein